MTEALRRVLAYEFDTLGVPQVSASCHLPNIGSARVMEKAGMRFTHVSAGPDMGGTWREQNQFRITREEWARLRQES